MIGSAIFREEISTCLQNSMVNLINTADYHMKKVDFTLVNKQSKKPLLSHKIITSTEQEFSV